MKESNTVRLWTREFILYIGLTILSFLFMSMNNPVIPIFVVDKFQCSTTEMGIIANAFIMSAMIVRPFAGYAIDRWGRRWTLLGALIAFALGNFSLLLPLNVTALLIIRILVGLPFSIITNVLTTLAPDIAPESRRSEGMSYFAIISNLMGASLASTFGLKLLGDGNYTRAFTGAGIVAVLSIVILAFMRFKDIKDPKAVFSLKDLFEGNVIWLALIQCLGWVGAANTLTYVPLYAQDAGYSHYGIYYLIYGVGMIGSRFLTGYAFDKKGPKVSGVLALSLLVLGYGLVGFTHAEVAFLSGGLFLGLGYGLLNSTLLAMAMQIVRPERRGACSATMFFGQDAGISLGSIFLGKIIDATGNYSSSFTSASIFTLIPIVLFIFVAMKSYSKKIQM